MILTFILLKDKHSTTWSAQCMEYDFATQAKSLELLAEEIQQQIGLYAALAKKEGRKLFEGMKPPPPAYNEYFNRAKFWLSVRVKQHQEGDDEN